MSVGIVADQRLNLKIRETRGFRKNRARTWHEKSKWSGKKKTFQNWTEEERVSDGR